MKALQKHPALRCALAAVGFASAACGEGEQDNPYALDRLGTNVEVTQIYRDCETNADCTLVDVTCNTCCLQDAVHTSLTQVFENERMLACADFDGPVCGCIPEPMAAQCVNGACTAVSQTE